MESEELQQRLVVLEQKIDATFKSAEKTRKYLLWTMIASLAVIVLPLIGLVFAIPKFINTLDVYKSIL